MKTVRRYVLLGMMLYSTGLYSTIAHAASIESLVMPGPVIEAHAEVEQECASCHSAFSQAQQNKLCLVCHEEVAVDLDKRVGFHGIHPDPARTECRSCHTEHKGRAADIVGLVPEGFDHDNTNFPLTGDHAAQPCASCHAKDTAFRDTERECASCHENDDPHRSNLGQQCGDCHEPSRWSLTRFDHNTITDFRLNGAHSALSCASCHVDQIFEKTPDTCASCHALDDVHAGERGDQCQSCHTEKSWADSSFDHRAETDFALQGRHSDLTCSACHLSTMSLTTPPSSCAGCHSADDVHRGQRGTDCAECHSSSSWKTDFDHLASSGFALTGAHSDISCNQCHRGSLQDPLDTECEDCHASDDPHEGELVSCSSCHNESSWTNRVRFDHEFTEFPLLGMHGLATCDQCHVSAAFHNAAQACADCHTPDDKHDGSLGTDCGQCHNPSGWALWNFDHTATDFALDGAHQGLVCNACHLQSAADPLKIATSCISCHSNDDAHQGQFGNACERCHSTEAFTGARFD